MPNLFLNLPLPAGDGAGSAVNVSTLGAEKTMQVAGTYQGTITFEGSNDGGSTWVPLRTFSTPKAKITLDVAVQYMRVVVSGSNGDLPDSCGVSSNDDGGLFVNLPATAGAGTGANVDVSALGTLNTVVVTGTFGGTVAIEISDDGSDFVECMTFSGPGFQTKTFTARFMRVTRKAVGVIPGLPVVNVGAINDAGAGSGGGDAVIGDPSANGFIPQSDIEYIYVRSGGDDAGGDGLTPATAYATIQRAFLDVPGRFQDKAYVIECTGLGTVDLGGNDLSFPPVDIDGGSITFTPEYNVTSNIGLLANLTIVAEPTVASTIEAGDVTGTVVNPYSSYVTLQTNLNLALDELRGKIFVNQNNERKVIVSNTAGPNSEIRTIGAAGVFDPDDYPLQILEPSCRITNGGQIVGGTPGQGTYGFNGIGIDVTSYLTGNIFAFLCEITGGCFWYPESNCFVSVSSFSGGGDFISGQPRGFGPSSCAFLNSGSGSYDFAGRVRTFSTVFDGGRYVRFTADSGGDDLPLPACIVVEGGEFSNMTFEGALRIEGGLQYGDLRGVDFASNSTGLLVKDGAYCKLSNCGSTIINSVRGVRLENGSQVELATNTIDIQGTTADYKVGNNADSAGAGAGWAAFANNEQEHDLSSGVPSMTRLFRAGATVDKIPLTGGGGVQTVEIVDSATPGSSFATSGGNYTPLAAGGAAPSIDFQYGAPGNFAVDFLYSMSVANAGDVDLRLDRLVVGDGDDPDVALTAGSVATFTPGNDTNAHLVQAAEFQVTATEGDEVFFSLNRPAGDTHPGDFRLIGIRVRSL